MNRTFITFLLCSALATLSAMAAAPVDLEKAKAQYEAADYTGAVNSYEQLLKDHGPDATVFYNLGNSYQQLKQYGPAILAYERARLLTPRDPDLIANLALARKAAAAFEESPVNPRWSAALGYLSRNEWSWMVAGSALFIGVVSLLSGIAGMSRRWMRRTVATLVIFAGMFITAGSTALWLRRGEASRGIVVSENATVRLSPFENAESIGTPGSGRIVLLGAKQGDFQYIEVPDASLRGWLSNTDVESIQPEDSRK